MKKLIVTLVIFIFSIGITSFATETDVNTENPPANETAEAEITTETPVSNDKLITELYAFTGKLYYCDLPTDRVVLKSVTPAWDITPAKAMAKEAEYMEIRISSDGLFMADGTKIQPESLNIYADSDVWVIIARTAEGNLIIPYFQFK